jgi:hypothetical protein
MSETCNHEEKVGGLDISSVHNLSVFLEPIQIKNGFFINNAENGYNNWSGDVN